MPGYFPVWYLTLYNNIQTFAVGYFLPLIGWRNINIVQKLFLNNLITMFIFGSPKWQVSLNALNWAEEGASVSHFIQSLGPSQIQFSLFRFI